MTRQPIARNFNKVAKWTEENCLQEIASFVRRPPLHSVVVHIDPKAAAKIIAETNTRNRPLSKKAASRIGNVMTDQEYALTGDTIKFSETGVLLDGQHRLEGCAQQDRPIVTHIVFGLKDDVFDVLDQGKKRTPGDILALSGFSDYTVVASAVSWVLRLQNGAIGDLNLSPRTIRQHAQGDMKKIVNYMKDARLLNTAFKYPPSQIAALLFVIGAKNEALAHEFAAAWAHGPRLGRNKNFDVLSARLIAINRMAGGHTYGPVRMALFVQTFNHWNANQIASGRAMTWRKDWAFPQIETDPANFKKKQAQIEHDSTTLAAAQLRLGKALEAAADKSGVVKLNGNADELAKKANIPPANLSYIIRTMVGDKLLAVAKKGSDNKPIAYRVNATAFEDFKDRARGAKLA